ncbi:MAG: hypothetical protein ACLUYV_05230 [Alistipes shahii]
MGGVPLCDKPDVLMTSEIAKLNKERATEQETGSSSATTWGVRAGCTRLGFGNFRARTATGTKRLPTV